MVLLSFKNIASAYRSGHKYLTKFVKAIIFLFRNTLGKDPEMRTIVLFITMAVMNIFMFNGFASAKPLTVVPHGTAMECSEKGKLSWVKYRVDYGIAMEFSENPFLMALANHVGNVGAFAYYFERAERTKWVRQRYRAPNPDSDEDLQTLRNRGIEGFAEREWVSDTDLPRLVQSLPADLRILVERVVQFDNDALRIYVVDGRLESAERIASALSSDTHLSEK